MHIDKRLLKITANIKVSAVLTIFFGLLTGIFTIGQAYYLSYTINKVFLEHSVLSSVLYLIIIILTISILKAVSNWNQNFFANRVAGYAKNILRKNILNHLFSLGPNYTKSERTGEISNTITNGVEKLDAYFSQFLPQLFLSALIPIIILFFIFPIDFLTGIVFIVTAPLIPIFMILIGSIAESLNKKQWKLLSRMSAYFLDVIQGLTTLKIFGRSKDQIDKISKISNAYRTSTMKVLRVAFLSALVLELLSTISIAIVAVEIGLRLMNGNLEFQPALFILILAPEFYLPIRQLGTRYHAGMEGMAAAKSIFGILETPLPENKIMETGALNFLKDTINFSDVYYSYNNGERKALQGLSFSVEPGKVTALIGESGSGKTTVINLLLRFFEQEHGKITINNKNINKIDIDKWREQIAWVSQNPYLFHKTIRENILLAKPDANEDDLIQAAQSANIYDFIKSLPQGFETLVGERGTLISGGEAQRIALARAFLKNAPLLIMDEPTANLDPQTEAEMISSLKELIVGRTVLIIAHRLNTIKEADKIIVFSNGKIVEQGNHKELYAANGAYKNLLRYYEGKTK